MVQTLNQNQFSMIPVQGDLDLLFQGGVISALVSPNQATALIAGQAVKLENSASPMPTVLALAGNSDSTFAFVIRTLKDQNFPTKAAVEIAFNGAVMQMTAGAAIARGANVEVVQSTNKVITSAGVNPVIGFALDQATADTQVIRVYIRTPGSDSVSPALKTVNVTATLAQINAGLTLIPGAPGRAITVTDITERVVGAFTTTTSVDLQSTNATPVKVSVAAVAALTNGAVLKPGDANVSRAAGYAVPLGSGDGLAVANVGTAAAGGTSIQYTITYAQL